MRISDWSSDVCSSDLTAVFTLAYANLGVSPDGGSTFSLPRLIGMRRAMEVALLADRFDAAKATELGLVNRVVPEADLAAEPARLAARLAAGPPRAQAATQTPTPTPLRNTPHTHPTAHPPP